MLRNKPHHPPEVSRCVVEFKVCEKGSVKQEAYSTDMAKLNKHKDYRILFEVISLFFSPVKSPLYFHPVF